MRCLFLPVLFTTFLRPPPILRFPETSGEVAGERDVLPGPCRAAAVPTVRDGHPAPAHRGLRGPAAAADGSEEGGGRPARRDPRQPSSQLLHLPGEFVVFARAWGIRCVCVTVPRDCVCFVFVPLVLVVIYSSGASCKLQMSPVPNDYVLVHTFYVLNVYAYLT